VTPPIEVPVEMREWYEKGVAHGSFESCVTQLADTVGVLLEYSLQDETVNAVRKTVRDVFRRKGYSL
jgi:hypothetical protein